MIVLLQVVFWASNLSPATQASILSCPYNVSIIGVGAEWPYNGVKLKLTFDYIRHVFNLNNSELPRSLEVERQWLLTKSGLDLLAVSDL